MPAERGNDQGITSLYASHVRIPLPPRDLVEPPALARLDEPATVTTVVAPDGAGKTTLLSMWAQRLAAGPPDERASVAWLTASAADDEPERFGQSLVLALRQARVLRGEHALVSMRTTPADPLSAGVPALLAELDAATGPLVLVIDDCDVLACPSVHRALAALIQHAPMRVRFVLCASSPSTFSGLPTRRHRAIEEDDLRFTDVQARRLLAHVLGERVNDVDVATALAMSQGRPAQLLLAGLAGLQRGGRARRGRGGSDRRDLTRLLLSGMTAEDRRFLLQTAELDAMSGELCDAVLDRADSAEYLDRLPERVGPLVRADPSGTWHRYHPVLRSGLTAQSSKRTPAHLLVRASDWFATAGDRAQAVHYRVAAGDHRGAASLLAQAGGRIGARGFLALAGHVDKGALVENGPLCLAMATATSAVGDRDAANAWLHAARQVTTDDVAPVGWRSGRAALWAVETVVRGPRPDSTGSAAAEATWLAEGERAVQLECDPGLPGWAVSRIALGTAMIGSGRVEGIEILRDGVRRADALGVPAALSLPAKGILASALLDAGRADEARLVLSRERAKLPLLERDLGGAAAGLVLWLRLAEGRLAHRAGQWDVARDALTRSAAHSDTLGLTAWREAAHSALAEVESARDGQSAMHATAVTASTAAAEDAAPPL